jgi:hypothetical protein
MSACGHAEAGIKGEGAILTFYERITFYIPDILG